MKILVTNDDGINSPGLWAAVQALLPHGEVFVVAPDREHSGVGTALTLHAPVRATRIKPPVEVGTGEVIAYAIEGTPGDSAVLALENLVGPVDLVISGINQGSNIGEDVLVSGTVGGAIQGYVRGYPSIAISVGALKNTRYDVAAVLLGFLGAQMKMQSWPRPLLLNINLPNLPMEGIKGLEVTRMGRRSYTESVKEGEDERRKHFWILRNRMVPGEHPKGTDVWALQQDRVSVTPLHTRLTDEALLPVVQDLFAGFLTASTQGGGSGGASPS